MCQSKLYLFGVLRHKSISLSLYSLLTGYQNDSHELEGSLTETHLKQWNEFLHFDMYGINISYKNQTQIIEKLRFNMQIPIT